MQALLDRWSCSAYAARSLAALIENAREGFWPDIVLADYHLDDGRDGVQAVQALREQFGIAVPAIVITADRAPAVAENVRQAECELLLKPVRPAELRALMLHLLAPAGQSFPG